jgi:hypothetical protein
MSRFSAILSSCAMFLLPAIGSAQSATLEICNNARIPVNVAYAARIQLFITGYKWKTTGWYVVDAGECKVVYDEDYDDAGPYTPQSGARVAFVAVTDGMWRAYHSNLVRKNGWMQSGTGQICVKLGQDDAFTYNEPAGDPAANCSDGTLIPVAQDFMPDGPGKFTYTMDWDGEVSSVAVAKFLPSNKVASANGANTPVDSGNSVSAQFLRYLEQAARDSAKRANSQSNVDAFDAKGRAAMLQWVREDLTAYIDASKTGFEAYKSGEAQPFQGYRMWTSREKPALASGCWVIQGDTTSTFSCVIPVNKESERAYYTQVTEDVTASLPGDWSPVAGAPFGGNLPSTGYRSSSGAHGEIWLTEATDGGYELHYQLVSAPTGPQPPKPPEDDPIGHGGFITPPTPPNR